MLQIMSVTFKEVIRKRIILLVAIGTIIYLVIYGFIASIANHAAIGGYDDNLLMKSAEFIPALGLYFSNLITAFMSIMASAGSVSSEIESGILHSVIARPVKRQEYIIGKYLGLAMMISVYSILLYILIFLLTMMINPTSVQYIDLQQLLYGMLLFVMQPLAILSFCIYGSVSFKTMNNGILAVLIYILGLLGGVMEQIGALMNNDILYQWGIISSLISPFDIIYRQMMSVLYSNIGFTGSMLPGASFLPSTQPSNWMMIYVVIYSFLLLFFAVRKFNKKDL